MTTLIPNLPKIQGVKVLIIQLFQNLIYNAIKFRRDEPLKIEISVEESPTFYTFRVQDNGRGISIENQDKIFQPFSKLETITITQGTGLGLTICEKIVKKHFGKIWVKSEYGSRTTFYFTIKKTK